MDLEEAAGPVMLPRIFHRHATGRNPAVSFLKRRHLQRDLARNVSCGSMPWKSICTGVSICGSLIAAIRDAKRQRADGFWHSRS
jgi:hypothetical protein